MGEKDFSEKVMCLQRRMYSVALKTGLSAADAADAVQEAQLRLWRGREGLPDSDSALRAYCLTTLRNECISVIRKRREMAPIESVDREGSAGDADSAESRDTRRHVERMIDRLPEGQRLVIRMSGFGGFEVSEISEATGFSQANVRQLLSRARKRLRVLMET